MKTTSVFAAVLVLVGASADAQQIAGSFDQLRVLVKLGDRLTVTDEAGARVQGKLIRLSASSLVLDVPNAPREFLEWEVDRIEQRGPDSLKNGALIGLGIGAGFGAAALAASGADTRFVAMAALLYSGIGAGIGSGLDALIEGRRLIYAGSPASRTTVNLLSVPSGPRKSIMVLVRVARPASR